MSWPERIFSIGIGMVLVVGSFQKVIYMRGALSKGPWTHQATRVGRACIFGLGATLIFMGATGITEFWRLKK